MNIRIFARSIAILTAINLCTLLSHADLSGIERIKTMPVFKGVERIEYKRISPKLQINVLKIDYSQADFKLRSEASHNKLRGNETLPRLAKRVEEEEGCKVIAGVNADFWGTYGVPIGMCIEDRQIKHAVYPSRSALYLGAEGPELALANMDSILRLGKIWVPIHQVNNSVPAYVPPVIITSFHWQFPIELDKGKLFVFEYSGKDLLPDHNYALTYKKTVTELEKLEANEIAIYANEEIKEQDIKDNAKDLELIVKLSGIHQENITSALGGLPMLVQDGKDVIQTHRKKDRLTIDSFITSRHPRTAIGIDYSSKLMYLVTVDGRQPEISTGIDLHTLAEFFCKELGCEEAMNFDGGGSTSMYVRGAIVNSPSDAGGPRSITNALLLTTTKKAGPPESIALTQKELRLYPGTRQSVQYTVYDAYYNPLPIASSDLTWTLSDDKGNIENGIYQASPKPGIEDITLSYQNLEKTIKVDVIDNIQLQISPSEIKGQKGKPAAIKIKVLDQNRQTVQYNSEDLQISGAEGLLVKNGTLTFANTGKGTLQFKLGNTVTEVPYQIGFSNHVDLDTFDGDFAIEVTSKGAIKEDEKVQKIEEGFHDHHGIEVRYHFAGHKTSALYLKHDWKLPEYTNKIGLYMKGDNSENWLRAVLKDADGDSFLLDMTAKTKGITWSDWQRIEAPLSKMTPGWGNPGASPDPPFSISSFYIVQTQVKLKKEGRIVIDQLFADFTDFSDEEQK